MRTLRESSLPVMVRMLSAIRRDGCSVRGGTRAVCVVLIAMAVFATVPFHTAVGSEVQMDRIWELELRGRVQAFHPSLLTIDVDKNLYPLSYDFQVIRDGRVVDPGEVALEDFVILDKRDGAVKRIFLMEEEPR